MFWMGHRFFEVGVWLDDPSRSREALVLALVHGDIHKPVLWLRQDIPRAWFWRTSRRSGSVRNAGDTVRAPRHRAREGALSDRRADVVLHTPLLQEHLTTLIWRGFRRIREDPRSSQREGPRA